MRLQHIHLPALTPYPLANRIQSHLVQRLLDHHHPPALASTTTTSSSLSQPPILAPSASPTLLTFTTPPTYTSGRRQSLTRAQIAQLTTGTPPASFCPSPRGGLLTFHGPGQLTAYLVLHLKSHGLGVRDYVRFLEGGLIGALKRYGVRGFVRCEWPGVWVREREGEEGGNGVGMGLGDKGACEVVKGDVPGAAKMVSIGVHVRRGVTGFGAGLNVSTDREWWERFDACGIEGVKMMALRELAREKEGLGGEEGVEAVGEVLAEELAEGLMDVDGVKRWQTEEVQNLLGAVKERAKVDGESAIE